MQDDLAALKKGQSPAGFKIEKESEKEVKPMPQTTTPKIIPPSSISHVELGKLEKAKPLTAEGAPSRGVGLGMGQAQKPAVSVPPRFGLSKPTINIPSVGGLLTGLGGLGSKKLLLVVAGLVIVVGIVIGFVVLRGPETPGTAITPTFTPRVTTATPALLESLFSISDSVGIALGPDFNTRFIDSIKTDPLFSSREPGIYKITSTDGIKRYGFTEFLGGVSVAVPNELKPLIDDGNLWLTLTYKSDNTASFGFIAKLLSPAKNNEVIIALQNWEGALTQALANLFKLDQTKPASVGFLDNTYNGIAVKYRNFPDTNSTIDYAVVRAKNGENYLVVVNSREHIYKIVDKLK